MMGPWHNVDERSRTHRRSPTDFDAEHCLLRIVRCVSGSVDLSLTCEPVFDYGRRRAGLALRRRRATARWSPPPRAATSTLRLTTDLRPGIEGPRPARPHPHGRGRRATSSPSRGRRCRRRGPSRRPTSGCAARRSTGGSGSPWATSPTTLAQLPAAQRAHPQGSDLRADGGAARRRDDVAAGDAAVASATGTTATPGCATRRSRCGACTRSASTARPTTSSTSSPTRAVTGDDLQVMYGVGGERELVEELAAAPVRLRGRLPGAHRQRRVLAAPARRVGCRARLGVPARPLPRAAARVALAGAQASGRAGCRALGGAGPRHLGGAWRAAALHLQQAHVLGRAGPRCAAGPDARRAAVRREVADPGRPDPCRHLRQRRRRARRLHPAVRRRRAGRLAAAAAADAVPAGRRPTDAGHRPRHRRRAHRRRARAALQGRGDRRRPLRRGGQLHDLLVLAGVGPRRDRRGGARRASCASGCWRSPARSSCTPRRSTRTAAGTSATSRRPSRTWRSSTRSCT